MELTNIFLVEVEDEVLFLERGDAAPALRVVKEVVEFTVESSVLEGIVGAQFDLGELGKEGQEWGVVDVVEILHGHWWWNNIIMGGQGGGVL